MPVIETFEVHGHIVDSLLLAKILDLILESGADYRLAEVSIGRTASDTSTARIEVTVGDADALARLAEQLQVHGANPTEVADAELVVADLDGVLPTGFHSTTNLDTEVRVAGAWLPVANPEMDCGLLVEAGAAVDPPAIRTVPMHRVVAGDRIVVGTVGVRVRAPESPRRVSQFEFMDSEVSSEKPKSLLIAVLVERIRAAKERGERVLAVCGPAVVHTGGAPEVARLVRGGWVDVLFAGNGFATHDIESNVLGTSLGVSVVSGAGTEGGHSNHLRVINEVRRHGSIAAAVRAGYIGGGVMYECVQRDVPFVLGGSIRDDGPLPDTMTDVVAAADRMRELTAGVGVALMLATTLHAIATGNVLPGRVDTWCVDINQAVVTKLADRGSHQAHGVVTDVGPFLRSLADALDAPHVTEPDELGWGRRYLMCEPRHFGVLYEINPWMHAEVRVDVDRARAQWEALATTLRAAGAEIELIEQPEGVPDLVFTANAGIVNADAAGGPRFVPSNFRHPERQGETEVFAAWFTERGWSVDRLPDDLDHEGAGDALPFGGVLVSGYRFRSDQAAATHLSALTGGPVRSVELVDERLYHVDITFCPLDERHAIGAPMGWDRYGRTVIEALVPEPLWLTDDEALSFCANSVVVGRTVIMPSTPPRVGRQLEAWGFDVVTCDVSEFLKAGGGCRCLTLALDVGLGPGASASR